MIIRKAYKYQLKVSNKDIGQKLAQYVGCRRYVWNKALGIQKARLENKQKLYKYTELASQLVLWKKDKETKFLAECHSQVLQQSLKQLDLALRNAFNKKATVHDILAKRQIDRGFQDILHKNF